VKNRRAIVRDDTDAPFEFVGAGYRPFQFSEAFDFMDSIHPNYVAGGALRGGRQGFLVVQPDRVIAPMGDKLDLYVVLRTSHDRSRGIEIAIMPLRGKCMNQLTLKSFAQNVKQRWSISHTANLHEKLHQAQHAMAQLDEYSTMFNGLAERLMLQSPTEAQARAILQKVVKHGGKKKDEEIEQILHLWHEDTEHVGYNDTGWGLLNAVSEQLEWKRPRQHGGDRFLSGLQGYVHQSVTNTAQALYRLAA
jgi:phage/plasmid-like protein (TIGR03299 family)